MPLLPQAAQPIDDIDFMLPDTWLQTTEWFSVLSRMDEGPSKSGRNTAACPVGLGLVVR